MNLKTDPRYPHWLRFYKILTQLLSDLTFCNDLHVSKVFSVWRYRVSGVYVNGNARATDDHCKASYYCTIGQHADCPITHFDVNVTFLRYHLVKLHVSVDFRCTELTKD